MNICTIHYVGAVTHFGPRVGVFVSKENQRTFPVTITHLDGFLFCYCDVCRRQEIKSATQSVLLVSDIIVLIVQSAWNTFTYTMLRSILVVSCLLLVLCLVSFSQAEPIFVPYYKEQIGMRRFDTPKDRCPPGFKTNAFGHCRREWICELLRCIHSKSVFKLPWK